MEKNATWTAECICPVCGTEFQRSVNNYTEEEANEIFHKALCGRGEEQPNKIYFRFEQFCSDCELTYQGLEEK